VKPVLVLLGIFGAALLYGDGMITPAISILSATEGLHVATPAGRAVRRTDLVAILVVLFFIQQYGTHRVGRLFGPVMVCWFATIALMGVSGSCARPWCSKRSIRGTGCASSSPTGGTGSRCSARCSWP
jgi:KUP system potassium uptake protein